MTNSQDSGTTCPVCGQSNDADSRFCNNCGSRIDGVCPSCGTENPPASHFCCNCGYDMSVGVEPEPVPEQTTNEQPWTGEEPTVVPQRAPADLRSAPTAPEVGLARTASAACPRCQHINDARSQYCFNCGLPLEGEAGFYQQDPSGIPAYEIGRPAGFWIRFLALIIDSIIITGALAILVPIAIDESIVDETQNAGELFFGNAMSIAYFTLLVGIWGATFGKRVLGLRIIRSDGSPVGIGRALVRELATFLSAFFLLIGYLIVAFRSDKRALHDLIADTVVIRVGS